MGVRRSRLLDRHDFRHAFATRDGGVSQPPYDTLNLAFHVGDREQFVRENRRRFSDSLRLPTDRLFEQRQVHGSSVREIAQTDVAGTVANAEGDALVARTAGFGVAARTADCVPVLIAHPPSGDVAAVHAGWRGSIAGVVVRAVEAMSHAPRELIAAIGPHIRVDAFEIGEEVAVRMESAAPGRLVVDRRSDKPHGDLARLITYQLLAAGLPAELIEDVGGCTFSETTHFFSHRRDRGNTGRHLSAIVARNPH